MTLGTISGTTPVVTAIKMTPPKDRGCFDPDAIESLRGIFSAAEFDRFLSTFLGELDVRPRFIATLIARGDYGGARAEAHRFKGGAMYFGRMPLVDLVERVEIEPEQALPALASSVVDAARDLVAAIEVYRSAGDR